MVLRGLKCLARRHVQKHFLRLDLRLHFHVRSTISYCFQLNHKRRSGDERLWRTPFAWRAFGQNFRCELLVRGRVLGSWRGRQGHRCRFESKVRVVSPPHTRYPPTPRDRPCSSTLSSFVSCLLEKGPFGGPVHETIRRGQFRQLPVHRRPQGAVSPYHSYGLCWKPAENALG